MRWLLILFLALALLVTAVACGEEKEKEEPPTASPAATATVEASPVATPEATPELTPSPEATATPEATPSAEETPAGGAEGFDAFRAFADQIEAALERRDAAFFVERALPTELTCTGEELPLPCAGQPAGKTISGIPSRAWASDASSLLDPEEYALWLEDYFDTPLRDLSDEYGSGSLTLYALAHSQTEGKEVFRAITTSIVDRYPTGTPIGQTEREAHVFDFVFENDRWQFVGETVALTSVTSPDWLSGSCAACYDHWERWEGAAVASPTRPRDGTA
jgi:hypothetical protein